MRAAHVVVGDGARLVRLRLRLRARARVRAKLRLRLRLQLRRRRRIRLRLRLRLQLRRRLRIRLRLRLQLRGRDVARRGGIGASGAGRRRRCGQRGAALGRGGVAEAETVDERDEDDHAELQQEEHLPP